MLVLATTSNTGCSPHIQAKSAVFPSGDSRDNWRGADTFSPPSRTPASFGSKGPTKMSPGVVGMRKEKAKSSPLRIKGILLLKKIDITFTRMVLQAVLAGKTCRQRYLEMATM